MKGNGAKFSQIILILGRMTKMYKKIMINDEDKTQDIKEILMRLGISEDMIIRFSSVITIQIYSAFVSRSDNIYRIGEEILGLEGLSRRGKSSTKPATMFSRKPYLRGLWHKHYQGSTIADLARNLQNALKSYSIPWLEEMVKEAKLAGEEREFSVEDVNRIAHEAVIVNYDRRSQENKLTGHWIIYAIHEGKNYYLMLARHTDDESRIRKIIDDICIQEYPFLNSILVPIEKNRE
ncbi:hypothetical protein [Pectobacterium carotovorum]|uniref:hypothetical protein n=1 Tax=Pectobacterium carotovorum TaxID=554 RepID=UPI0015FF8563|nr:hypothetical protein [Pectobacterium carotovorum]MBB1525186.1 hypothetical protein [Pectobacterium carotovorum subsp. carotovorum]MCA6964377.1 hypothetical protein [Pectobacterium carotovorum]MCA6973167.1 hypothetical protein [Pectobacterium carotovorum]MCH4986811.1 hypothetical protein [Pectobacterium carotovorum]